MSKKDITTMKAKMVAALDLLERFADLAAEIRKAVDDETWDALDLGTKLQDTLETAIN